MKEATILFICPHGAAKSVLAAAYLNQLAEKNNLPLVATFAGTDPSETISPAVIELLYSEGLDTALPPPHRVSPDELEQAQQVILLGCALQDLEIFPKRVEQWLDVPMVSQNLPGARDAIRAQVERLIATYKDTAVR